MTGLLITEVERRGTDFFQDEALSLKLFIEEQNGRKYLYLKKKKQLNIPLVNYSYLPIFVFFSSVLFVQIVSLRSDRVCTVQDDPTRKVEKIGNNSVLFGNIGIGGDR